MPVRAKDTYCVQSVENALALLEVLSEEEGEVSLSLLSERLGLQKASVFRLLATFENRGYVERKDGSRKYGLGLSAYEIGQKFLSRMELLRLGRPVMADLVRECNEAAYLVVRRHDNALFLDMVDCSHHVKIVSLAGRRFSLGSTAAGKIFLAFGETDPDKIDVPAAPLAPQSLSLEERDLILRQGFCVDRGTLGDGVACMALPVFNAGGKVAGVLTMLGPDFRLPPEKMEERLLPALRSAGEVISFKLGYLASYLGKHHPGSAFSSHSL